MATKKTASKNRTPPKIDMFNKVLPALDTRDKKFYENLSAEEKKDFSPWLTQRYLSSVESPDNGIIEHYLVMTNDIVNVNFSDIKDPEMLSKLMCIVGIGESAGRGKRITNHPFIPPPKKGVYDNAFKQWLSEENTQLNKQELEILFNSFTKTTARDLLEQFQVKDKDVIASANDL